MFLKKVARRKFKNEKKKKKAEVQATPIMAIPIYFQEPDAGSVESSEVEYIEDDADYAESVDGARMKPSSKQGRAKAKNDELLTLSVCVPSNTVHSDDDSCLSQDKGILTKLPRYLVEKSRNLSEKMELGPSMTESTTSEEQTENTCAETCSTSLGSDTYEMKQKKRLEAWRLSMEAHIDNLGEDNSRTAAGLLELGTMHLQREAFDRAREYFARAVTVSEAVFDMPDLRTAKALELYGVVQSAHTISNKDTEELDCALSCLDKAFEIRYELQGPQHIDTVEALNRIARVYLKQRRFELARDSYFEVLKLREAIFGTFHPCVAITARALAIAQLRLFHAKEAKFYLQAALHIYERNGLGAKSFADVVRKDLHDLERMKFRCEV